MNEEAAVIDSRKRPIVGYGAAVALIALFFAFAFSLWAEWGPYSWIAGAQLYMSDSYEGNRTGAYTVLLFIALAVAPLFLVLEASRKVKMVALGIPAACLLGHILLTAYFSITGGAPAAAVPFSVAVKRAGFLPQNIILRGDQLPRPDGQHFFGIRTKRTVSESSESYLAFAATAWPDPQTPVLLKSSGHWEEIFLGKRRLEGTIRKAPLPYLVRRNWGENSSVIGIIVEDSTSVRSTWLLPGFIYIVFLLLGAREYFRSKRPTAHQELNRPASPASPLPNLRAGVQVRPASPARAGGPPARTSATVVPDSPYKFPCPHCGQRVSATPDFVGTIANCPACNRTFVVPAAGQDQPGKS